MTELLLRRPPGDRVRSRVLSIALHHGWHLLNTGRFETLAKFYYHPGGEVVWTGGRKPLDMPDRFRGHSEIVTSFGWLRQLTALGVDAEVRPIEILDAGGPCMAVRLQLASSWSRSTTPIVEVMSSVYTLARGRVAHQVVMFDDGVDLAAELRAALDRAGR